MWIRRFLGLGGDPAGAPAATPETDTVRRIVAALEALDPAVARHIAAFAYTLGRVARADMSVSEAETRSMEALVMQEAGLPEEQAILIVQIAKTQVSLFGGTENYLVTREFNRIATAEQKRALLRCLFAVGAADASVSVVEDNEIRRISQELQLTHAEFIEARRTVREHLAVLKREGS